MSKKRLTPDMVNSVKQEILSGMGYCQPPLHSRFKKGTSGNPKGRPRKVLQARSSGAYPEGTNDAIMSAVFNEPVKLVRRGKPVQVPKPEALQRNIEKIAFSGGIQATRVLITQARDEDERQRVEIEADHKFWREYLERRASDLAASAAMGEPPSRFWIEPEDIIFKDGQPAVVRGPMFADEVSGFEALARFVEVLMVETVVGVMEARLKERAPTIETALIAYVQSRVTAKRAKECQAFWDELTDAPVKEWRWLDQKRREAWARLGRKTPPRKPLSFSPMPKALQAWVDQQRDPFEKAWYELRRKVLHSRYRALTSAVPAHDRA